MPADVAALLDTGRRAMAAGDWSTARRSFEAVLDETSDAEALAGLGDALWWLGETDEAVRCQARAYAAFRRGQDHARAATAAIALYFLFRISLGNTVASRGWMGRAARLVDEFKLAPVAGWISLIRAHDSDDPGAARRWALEARVAARRFDDTDLELCALSQLGSALVQMGRLTEGEALLDEAMAASLGGEGDRLETVVYTSCNMLSACSQVAEVDRAAQWIRAADEFTHRYGNPHLFTTCRTYHAGVLFATGDWAGAERELEAALLIGRSAERAVHGEALARLSEVRLAQGRVEEAERLLEGYEDHFTSAVALAAVRLAQGRRDEARVTVRRRLEEIEEGWRDRQGTYRAGAAIHLEAAGLWELLTVAEIEDGAPEQAMAAARRLASVASTSGSELIEARALRARGLASAAAANRPAARSHLERALILFRRLAMPLEVAHTHLALADSLVEGSRATAIVEATTALEAFETLGAARDADRAAALLRRLGKRTTRHDPTTTGKLTRRELEVFSLLAEGLSNRQLAERLFVTRKTVEHHVASVLAKLGLRSRAEAAAYATRHPTQTDSSAR